MKKIIVALAVVLFVVIGIAPRYVGGKAEEQYGGVIEQLRLNGFQVADHEYLRSWMGSQATTELVLPLPQLPEEARGNGTTMPRELRFKLVSDIRHGPIIPDYGTALAVVDSEILVNGEQLFPENYPATLQTVLALDGTMTSRLDLPAKQMPVGSKGATIDFQGLEGTFTTDRGFTTSQVSMNSPGASVSENGIEVFSIGPLRMDSSGQRGVEGLMLGKGTLHLAHLRASDENLGEIFNVDEIALTAESDADGDKVAGSMTTTLKAVEAVGRQYGRTELTLSMGNLYAPVLAKIQQALEEVRTQNIDPQMQGMAVASTLMTQAPLLLKHDPKLAIDRLYVETPEGPVEGTLSIQSRDMTFDDLQGGFGFVQKLDASASIGMPETLFRQLNRMQTERQVMRQIEMRERLDDEFTPPGPAQLERIIDQSAEQQLAVLLDQKLVVRNGSQLESQATFQQGKLVVNGEPLDLPFLPPAQ